MSLIDKSKILLGDDIFITDNIILKQPTIKQIVDYGEHKFFNTFYSLCSIPSDMKSTLWDIGKDWNKMSDWELFLNLCQGINSEDTYLILGDIDFSQMQLMQNSETQEIILTDGNVVISEEIYNSFISNIREMIGYVVKREKAMNKATKMALIDEDRLNKTQSKNKNSESFLFSAIISLVNTEEFSYTYNNVKEMTLYQFIKSFYQIQNKKAACALYQGSMSGFVDTSKIDKKNFQWIYTGNKEES